MEENGRFYAVGVGPGDPSLLTLRAAEVLQRCPVIAAPQTAGGETAALKIASRAVDLKEKTILPLPFSMSRDPEVLAAAHASAVQAVESHLARGRDVAMLCLGDVSLYASAGAVLPALRRAGYEAELVPGVTSFSAAAAALRLELAGGDEPLHIVPVLGEDWKDSLSLPGTKVLMKPGSRLPSVFSWLAQHDLLGSSALVMNCGMEGERLLCPFDRLPEETGYFTLVIVKEGRIW